MIEVAYWGCIDHAGHYLHDPARPGYHIWSPSYCEAERLPRPEDLDGSRILLPRPEVPGHAALTYLPALDRTVLAWWDRTFDTRPGTNAAIIVAGRKTATECWLAFVRAFPALAAKLTAPASAIA